MFVGSVRWILWTYLYQAVPSPWYHYSTVYFIWGRPFLCRAFFPHLRLAREGGSIPRLIYSILLGWSERVGAGKVQMCLLIHYKCVGFLLSVGQLEKLLCSTIKLRFINGFESRLIVVHSFLHWMAAYLAALILCDHHVAGVGNWMTRGCGPLSWQCYQTEECRFNAFCAFLLNFLP